MGGNAADVEEDVNEGLDDDDCAVVVSRDWPNGVGALVDMGGNADDAEEEPDDTVADGDENDNLD